MEPSTIAWGGSYSIVDPSTKLTVRVLVSGRFDGTLANPSAPGARRAWPAVDRPRRLRRRLSSFVVGEIDGDGDPEVFVAGGFNQEGPDPVWGHVFTFKNGAIRDYAPADVDHDGRLDLMTPGPYAKITARWNGVYEYAAIGGVFTAHTLADGTFSMTDAVAKSALLKECPRKAPLAIPESINIDQADHDILCARAWGASEADIRAALAKRCKSWVDTVLIDADACPKVFLTVAKVTPPVTLP